MMGYRLTAGRMFAADETNAAVLTPAASRAMFKTGQKIVGERIPAGPKGTMSDVWHDGLRVVGIVRAGKVQEANALGDFIAAVPVAFMPYRVPLPATSDRTRKATLLLQHPPAAPPSPNMLDRLLAQAAISGISAKSVSLRAEIRHRLGQHFFASAGTLLVGAAVLIAAFLGALGTMRFICQKRLPEIGVRLALGAREEQLAWLLSRQELLFPAALALLWILLCVLSAAVLDAMGLVSPVDAGIGLGASLLVLAGLALGFVVGLLGPLRSAPMQALRAE
jgi:ABC-type antimicrobial peptide transport system permease subunit